MKMFAISVWLFFTLCAVFALLISAHECSSVSRPNLFWLTAETQSSQKLHKKRSNLTALSVRNLKETAKRLNPSLELESPSTDKVWMIRCNDRRFVIRAGSLSNDEIVKVTSLLSSASSEPDSEALDGDIYVKIVKLASEKKSEALAKYLPTVHSESLQKFIVHNIVPDCETCLGALVWALTSSSAYEQAANKLRGKVLFSVREGLFKSLVENRDNIIVEKQANASAIISLLSEANDDREREMMVALVNSDLPPSLRAATLKCIDPPFTQEVKDTLIAAVLREDLDTLDIAALEKIKEAPFAEVMPILAQIVISFQSVVVTSGPGWMNWEWRSPGQREFTSLAILGEAKTPEAKNALAEIATSRTDAGLITRALYYLNRIDANLAVSIAEETFLSDDCPDKRLFANTLSSFMDVGEREDFFTSVALSDSDCDRRAAAVGILAEISSTDSMDRVAETLLEIAWNDGAWGVRREAVQTLAKNNSAQVQRALIEIATSDSDCDVRGAAINSLDLSFPESVPALMQIAADPSGNYYAAMNRLSSTGSPEVGEFLLSILQKRGKDSGFDSSVYYHATYAAEYLKRMGGEYRVTAFREVMLGQGFSPWHRRDWAEMAAYYYPEPEIQQILRNSARNDPDEGVRDAAANSLQKIYEKYEMELEKSRLAVAPDASQDR